MLAIIGLGLPEIIVLAVVIVLGWMFLKALWRSTLLAVVVIGVVLWYVLAPATTVTTTPGTGPGSTAPGPPAAPPPVPTAR